MVCLQVARAKGDQLVRRLTAKLQAKLLGVSAASLGPSSSGSGSGGLYGLLNVDALLESVEGDLAQFLMQQHAKLTAHATAAAPIAKESLAVAGESGGGSSSGGSSGEGGGGERSVVVGGGGVVGQLSQALADDGAWDPRVAFMVGFLKDCARVSVQEQLELGLAGLQARLAAPGALKVTTHTLRPPPPTLPPPR